MLALDLGVPVGRGVALVRASSDGATIGALLTDSGLRVELPARLVAEIQERLSDAMQAAPRRARGRPSLRAE
jgi:hypothetical protein